MPDGKIAFVLIMAIPLAWLGLAIVLAIPAQHFGWVLVCPCYAAGALITGLWFGRVVRRNSYIARLLDEFGKALGPGAKTGVVLGVAAFWPAVNVLVAIKGVPEDEPGDDTEKEKDPS